MEACTYDAIHVTDGAVVVDSSRCVGCGLCAAVCPKGLIELIPAGKKTAVRCSSPDKGVEVRKLCAAGCIGCGLRVRQCPEEAEGRTYIHILNPRTGRPAESDLLSVTVFSENGARADALSTALFLMGSEEAAVFWRARGDFEMLLMTVDHAVWITQGLESVCETERVRTVLREGKCCIIRRCVHGASAPH